MKHHTKAGRQVATWLLVLLAIFVGSNRGRAAQAPAYYD
jgi:hypothetical protein